MILSTKKDSFRTKDWRWLRAQDLVDSRHTPTPEVDDEYVTQAYRFLVRLQAAEEPTSKSKETKFRKLVEEFGPMYYAFDAYSKANFIRWALEAMVVAKLPAEEIAVQIPCDVEIVRTYENTFFDVRDRLESSIYVLNDLLSPGLTKGASPKNFDFYWKSLGYFYGPEMLKEYWAVGGLTQKMSLQMDALISGMVKKNAAEASFTREINKYSAPEIMQEYMELLKIEHVKSTAVQPTTPIVDDAAVMLQAIQFSVKSLAGEVEETPERLASVMERLRKPDTNIIDVVDASKKD